MYKITTDTTYIMCKLILHTLTFMYSLAVQPYSNVGSCFILSMAAFHVCTQVNYIVILCVALCYLHTLGVCVCWQTESACSYSFLLVTSSLSNFADKSFAQKNSHTILIFLLLVFDWELEIKAVSVLSTMCNRPCTTPRSIWQDLSNNPLTHPTSVPTEQRTLNRCNIKRYQLHI